MRNAWALDNKRLNDWVGCFSHEGSYACISRENEDRGLPLCLMLDDCRERLLDRVKFIEEVWAGTFEDYSTRHFVQRMSVEPDGADRCRVESNFQVAFTTMSGESAILAVGTYRDVVVAEREEAVLAERRVIVDTNVLSRYLVYPL